MLNTMRSSFCLALLLATVLSVSAKEIVQETGLSDASSSSDQHSVHIAKKRSALEPDSAEGDELLIDPVEMEYLPESDESDVDKRSSLFRFGKRQFRYGKRQFRYGKRQFRYGKRSSLFRFGKRSGGTLFRFGKRSSPAPVEADQREQELAKIALADLIAREAASYESDPSFPKRDMNGFHWGNDN